jgi:hypothetical protein
VDKLNKLVLHPRFRETIVELSKNSIFLPPSRDEQKLSDFLAHADDALLVNLEDIKRYKLDLRDGSKKTKEFSFSAYDESFIKFSALEGSAYFTTHSLIVAGKTDYIPVTLATFYFYTRSRVLASKSPHIKFAESAEIEFKRDLLRDKINFLLDYAPEKSLLLIDGPFIGGDLYTLMVDANNKFLEKEIIPVYFVKNSLSNIVTERIDSLIGKYNSDMHWLNTLLRQKERSCFFKYTDQVNKKNTKVFCYVKAFNSSPQRIEFHPDTYSKYFDSIPSIMNLILYLSIVQGSMKNPQLRPIAIAEMYARAVLRFIDVNKYFKEANITPTLNQVRFGG